MLVLAVVPSLDLTTSDELVLLPIFALAVSIALLAYSEWLYRKGE